MQGRKILIVDDDRLNIRILNGILRGEGYELAEASSGEQALDLYPRFKPDLILLDVVLPGINGFDACRKLRSTYGDEAAPVIFITAKAEATDVVEGFSAGGVDYLPKPFRSKEAVARIRTHLNTRVLAAQQTLLVEQLRRANEAKNKFLGMAAHDLRNPLASIRGLADFLQDPSIGALNTEQAELVETIRSTSHSLLDLVNELLDLATIEAGELKIRPQLVNLAPLVEKAVHLCNMEAARKQTKVQFAPTTAKPKLPVDPDKIRQVVDNLLSNAVKYSPPGSTITVEIDATPSYATLSVKDEGPGIPAGEQDRLFKDFSRLSVIPTGGEKSTGLGLAICRKIVEAHDGTITAENLRDRGCEFRVSLPLAP